MLPTFVPDENAPVSISEQECFYDLIKCLFQLAFDEPLLFVTSLHEDDAFPNRFNSKSYGKPKLMADMKKFTKSASDLLQAMFLLGQGKQVKIKKKQHIILSKLGINDLTALPAAWRWMATKDGSNISTFTHCLFNDSYPYTSEIYARLLGDSAFKKLENWMLAQGYKRYDIYGVTASHCNLSLSIVNPKWSKEPPSGGFEYKIKHTGISARFDPYIANPAVFGLCIPKGMMKLLIEAFETMSENLKCFFIKQTTKCWNCRYCVQTDKTGTRPLAFINVNHKKNEYNLCTYFPGYSYCWTSIDDDLVNQLIEMLSFMDRFVPKQG